MTILPLVVWVALSDPTISAPCSFSFEGPEVLSRVISTDITEASGLAASWRNPGILWTHNDGPREKVFALNQSGEVVAVFRITKSVSDLEDVAVGPGPVIGASYLYLGDIGSNGADRDTVEIYRVPEPVVTSGTADFSGLESFQLKYPSGKYDAEALLVDPIERMIYIATKENAGSHLFRFPIDALDAGRKVAMEAVAQLDFARISGGAISRDGGLIALRREETARIWRRGGGESVVAALARSSGDLPVVGPPDEPNGESITFLTGSSSYVTLSEGVQQPFYHFRIASSAAAQFVTEPRFNESGLVLQVAACVGSSVVIERSTDLENWQPAESFSAGSEIHTFIDRDRRARTFYRLVTL